MSIRDRVEAALAQGWDYFDAGASFDQNLPIEVVQATETVLAKGSAPNRQMLLTIVAGTAEDPSSNVRSLQASAGVDRRSQAKAPSAALSTFMESKGFTLKYSKDPGVSNQWRRPELDQAWVENRKSSDRGWAEAFYEIVNWLAGMPSDGERRDAAQELLEFLTLRLIETSAGNSFAYPRFHATPDLAFSLLLDFLGRSVQRPDAMEAIVVSALRSLSVEGSGVTVERGDINSPDPIDVLVLKDGRPVHGVEVTDEYIGIDKLKHEVLPAMQKFGLTRASVVSSGTSPTEADEIHAWIDSIYARFGQRIDLVTIAEVRSWLTVPTVTEDLVSKFLWGLGEELDAYSTDSNRREWFEVLTEYVTAGT